MRRLSTLPLIDNFWIGLFDESVKHGECFFFFSSRRRHTSCDRDWSSDVCSSDLGGTDGVHPGPNGHLLMAYAFLKAMGVDGQIGSITVDLRGKAASSEGHKIVGEETGKVEIESSRYPFCFSGDEKSPKGTRSILPYVPFNADLN